MKFDKDFLEKLFEQAQGNPRLRQNFDLRTSFTDTSQRMLNILLPGTVVPIHRHRNTSETVICLYGEMDEVFYEESIVYENLQVNFSRGMDGQDMTRKIVFREVQRIRLCPARACYGCQVPKGMWHTVEVFQPSVIFEAKDGAYAPAKSEDVIVNFQIATIGNRSQEFVFEKSCDD